MSWRYDYRPYVPVAKRRAQAAREVARRVKKGEAVSPVVIEGRTIVSTFWGKAWCTNLESYSDFENRLPRGRTYVRNGSVVHLKVDKGRITALVSGSELYTIQIEIAPLPQNTWKSVKALCAGKIGSLVELLQGKLSHSVMEAVTNRADGLFPKPKEISMRCSCPDYAGMCKHLAAVMYGIGSRLDSSPELLFHLRGVDHQELIEQALPATSALTKRGTATIDSADLGAIFDIEIDDAPPSESSKSKTTRKTLPKARKAPKVKTTPAAAKPAPAKKPAQRKAVTVKKAAREKTATQKKNATLKKAAVTTKKRATRVAVKG